MNGSIRLRLCSPIRGALVFILLITELAVEQMVKFPVIWQAMQIMSRYCNADLNSPLKTYDRLDMARLMIWVTLLSSESGVDSIWMRRINNIEISVLKLGRSWECLIVTIGILIQVRRHIYTESGPWPTFPIPIRFVVCNMILLWQHFIDIYSVSNRKNLLIIHYLTVGCWFTICLLACLVCISIPRTVIVVGLLARVQHTD